MEWCRRKERENPLMPTIEMSWELIYWNLYLFRIDRHRHHTSSSISSLIARRNFRGVSVVSQSLEFITNIVRSYFLLVLFIKWFANAHGAYMHTHYTHSSEPVFVITQQKRRRRKTETNAAKKASICPCSSVNRRRYEQIYCVASEIHITHQMQCLFSIFTLVVRTRVNKDHQTYQTNTPNIHKINAVLRSRARIFQLCIHSWRFAHKTQNSH